MRVLKDNSLLLWSLVVAVTYWMVAPVLPSQYLAGTMSLLLLVAGTLTFAQYAEPAYRVLWLKERSEHEGGRGSHLAIYGVFLFAFGSVFAGGFGVIWNIAGQPPDWVGTATSNFSRLSHIAGFALMQVSPDITPRGLALRGRWWAVAISLAIALGVGFWLGLQMTVAEVRPL